MKAVSGALVFCLLLMLAAAAMADTHHHGHDRDMQKRERIWKKVLSRPSLAVTIESDRHGKLWRARVSDGRILISQSTNEGQHFGAEIMVNAEAEAVAANGENRPKLAFGSGGQVYVSWTRLGNAPFSGDIRFSYSGDGGKSFSRPVTINTDHQATSHRFESMLVDSNDRIWLFWLDKRDHLAAQARGEAYTGAAVYHTWSDNGGREFVANRKLQDHSCECCRIALGVTRDAEPVVLWRHVFDGGIRDHAIQFVDGKSSMHRLARDNWQVNACPHHGPSIAVDNNNRVHAVWYTGATGKTGIYYASAERNGDAVNVTVPRQIGNTAAQAAHADIATANGVVYIAWKEFSRGESQVRLQTFSDNRWSAVQTLAHTDGASDYPMITVAGGKALLVWQTQQDGLLVTPVVPVKSR